MMNVKYIMWRVCAGDVKDPRVGKKKESNKERENRSAQGKQ